MKLTAFILLYNKKITDSITYNSLKDLGVDVYIYDNSPKDFGNHQLAKELGIMYDGINQNIGLSKAYNHAFRAMTNKTDYLILLDDDTHMTQEYIDVVNENIVNDNTIDIFIPKVLSAHNNKLYSPEIKVKNNIEIIHGINSGLVISHNLFSNYYYNEKLFLYFVDLQFFTDNQDKKMKVMDIEITQNFSEYETKYSKAMVFQFQLRLNDAKKYFTWYKYYPYLIIFCGSKFIQLKKFSMIKLFFRNIYKGER